MRKIIIISILTIIVQFTVTANDQFEPIHIESLLAQSAGMERRFASQGLLFSDRDLDAYLTEILHSVALPDEINLYNLRVRVLRSGAVNAFGTPHGVVYVCAGLLARIDSEAQAAALLAHELAHIVNHHAAKNLIMMKESARAHGGDGDFSAILGEGMIGGITGSALRAALSGYNRDLEREADSVGLLRMTATGYPHGEFRRLFEMLQEYVISENIKEPYFFSTHPRLAKRLVNYERIIAQLKISCQSGLLPKEFCAHKDKINSGDEIEKGYFCIKIRNIILYDIDINISAGKFMIAETQLDRLLSLDNGDVKALVTRGDMERRLSPRSSSPAEWYGKALAKSPNNAPALRGMGFMYYAIGNKDMAKEYLRRYCELSPEAVDIKMAREMLRRVEE